MLADPLLLALTLAVSLPPAGRCTIIPRPWVRGDSLTYLMGMATADTLPAVRWRPVAWAGIRREGAPPPAVAPAPSRDVYGQVVRVNEVSRLQAGSQALLVFWGMGSMCESRLRDGSARVLAPGLEFFVETWPHPDSLTLANLSTFEVRPGTRLYVPAWEQERSGRSLRRLGRRARVLSVTEYGAFYRALPGWSAWDADPASAAAPTRAWARRHPELAERAPARDILRQMETALAEERRR